MSSEGSRLWWVWRAKRHREGDALNFRTICRSGLLGTQRKLIYNYYWHLTRFFHALTLPLKWWCVCPFGKFSVLLGIFYDNCSSPSIHLFNSSRAQSEVPLVASSYFLLSKGTKTTMVFFPFKSVSVWTSKKVRLSGNELSFSVNHTPHCIQMWWRPSS